MSLNFLRTAGFNVSLVGLLSALSLTVSSGTTRAAITYTEVRKIVDAEGAPSAADVAKMDEYLKKDFFGQFVKPATGETLPLLRKEFGNIVRGVGKNAAHDKFNALVFSYAGMVTKGKRFPAMSKYNSLLLIGDLNEAEEVGKVKPYVPSLDLLIQVLAIPPNSEMAFLKPAALVGITRFAEEKAIPPAKLPAVSEALLKLVNETDAPAGRSASAHNFMRRSAAKALAAIGSPGPDNRVLNAFEAIAADPKGRLTLRCEMAQYIGALNIPPEAKVDSKALANIIGHQVVEICQQELDRAVEEKREPSRRVLMYALYSGGVGLSGISRSADKSVETTKFIKDVRDAVTSLYKLLDDPAKKSTEIADAVTQTIASLNSVLLAKPTPAALVAGGNSAKP